jgi:uracil-DNA glycosylase family 4
MAQQVKDQENWNAQIMVVGELPAREEHYGYMSCLGDGGYKLKEWCKYAGLKYDELYITNVFTEVFLRSKLSLTTVCNYNDKLVERITNVEYPRLEMIAENLPNLRVIVCIGDYAIRAFTRFGNVSWDSKAPGIGSIRGSVYEWITSKERGIYVIPTLHPTVVNRQPTWERRCISDWKKAARIVKYGYDKPKRTHIIYPDLSAIKKWWRTVEPNDVISFDIETWGDGIKCVGLAKDASQSLVIPTELWAWTRIEGKESRAKQSLVKAWEYINVMLMGPNDKVGQGALFDCWWLAQPEYNVKVKEYHWDTLCMHHALVPNETHALHFLASVYTDEPYWKDEAKEADAIIKIARGGMDQLYVYNGLDVTVTWEIFSKFYDQLAERSLFKFYFQHYADMFTPLLSIMLKGAPVNRKLVLESRRAYMARALQLRDEASITANKSLFKFNTTALEKAMIADYYVNGPGIPLGECPTAWLQHFRNLTKTLKSGVEKKLWTNEQIDGKWAELENKGISDDELNKVLYNEWKCPTGKRTTTGKEKADNVALKTLRNTVESRKRGEFMERKDNILRLIDLVLDHRRQRKLATFVNPERLDDDDRIRCTYKFTPKTGRLSSATNPKGTGTNLQNQDRAIRSIYIASPGRILLECDLSQAEGRVVKCLSGDESAIASARRLPTEGDEHTENAIDIFSHFYQREVLQEEVTKDLRQIGKKVVHASNYDQGKFGLSDTLLKEGYTMTPQECSVLIRGHREKNPYIDTYQSLVRCTVIKDRTLYTSWGRFVSFEHFRLDDELYKFAYSYVPQSEIGDLTNQRGLKASSNWLTKNEMESDLILQCHDSVVFDAVPYEVYAIMCFLKKHLEVTRIYGSCFGHSVELSIPVEFKLGLDWGSGKEWKTMPTKDEVTSYIEDLLNENGE